MPRTDLVIDGCGGNRIWVEAGEVTAESGLVPKLFIPAKLDLCPVNKRSFVISNVKCGLFLQNKSLKIADGISKFTPYTVFSSVDSIPCTIELTIDIQGVKNIEKYRKDNIKLRLDVHFDVSLYDTLSNQAIKGPPVKSETIFSQLMLEIPQSQWVKKILPSLGYLDVRLIELPSIKKVIRVSWKYILAVSAVVGVIIKFSWFLKFLWKWAINNI